ncbi:MAG: sigma-70 family RNA polymerase sigma factor [Clostridia bacterium]|nr:sigma-70 family RNA polymerase sigma factor [Clostridia bacterium]
MKDVIEKERPFDKNPELVKRFRSGDREAGEELIRLNTPLIYRIAARFRERCDDPQDLIECGTMGLCKAINTFDTERGFAFSTYAVPLIMGEMRRFLRDDGMIKVSREERRLCAILNRERERRLSNGDRADLASLAEAVGVSVQDASRALFCESAVRSLEESVGGDDESLTLGSTISDESEVEDRFDRMALYLAIEKLCERDRRIIILRYFRDFSQTETAKILGLSQVKISREEKKIMAKLRREMAVE